MKYVHTWVDSHNLIMQYILYYGDSHVHKYTGQCCLLLCIFCKWSTAIFNSQCAPLLLFPCCSEILYRLQSELEHFPLNKPLPIPGSSCCHHTIPSQIIPNLFEGQLQSEVKYLTCQHTSITTETFWDLSIDFPER